MRSYRWLFCSALVAFASSEACAQQVDAKAFEAAKRRLEKAVAAGDAAGAVHMVALGGQAVYVGVAGKCDIDDGRPMKADTIVRIYSMTKPITSVAAMKLYEQKKFALDDPVGRYIPSFMRTTVLFNDEDGQEIVPAKRPITVRDLLRHTSGYSYGSSGPDKLQEYYRKAGLLYGPPVAMLPPNMTIKEAAEALAKVPGLHQPGDRFTYGFNTDILGRLIEIWSGRPLDEYFREAIFVPLEMKDTGFVVPPQSIDRFASCHTIKDGKLVIADKAQKSKFTNGFKFLSGGGGLVSTMPDYANFCQMLMDNGEFHGRRILKPETIKLMFTDQLNGVAGDFKFGLGFAIQRVQIGSAENARLATQYSWGGYASTDFRLVPKEKLFQIVLRQQVPSSHKLAAELFPIVYQGLK